MKAQCIAISSILELTKLPRVPYRWLKGIGKLASGGIFKSSWAVRGCAPLWFSLPARLGQRASNTIRIEVFCINRRTRLLAPRLIEATGINSIEPKLID